VTHQVTALLLTPTMLRANLLLARHSQAARAKAAIFSSQ